MSGAVFKKVYAADRVTQAIQDNAEQAFRPLLESPFVGCRLIEDVELVATASNRVAHGLGRDIAGWIVVDRDASGSVWRVSPSTSPDRVLLLSSSAAMTVDLIVF